MCAGIHQGRNIPPKIYYPSEKFKKKCSVYVKYSHVKIEVQHRTVAELLR